MRRALLILAAVLVALPLAAVAVVGWFLDGDALKARAADAVRRATGRELTIAGPVRLAWSLTPTIEARDVSFANPPGMSRPAMAHLDRIEAEVALLPLLSRRVEVRRVVLVAPDVLLERDAAGRPNWVFSAAAPEPATAPAAAPAAPRMEVAVGSVEVEAARLGLLLGGGLFELRMPRLVFAPETGRVSGDLVINGVGLALAGAAGPLAGAATPLNVNLVGGGIAVTVSGIVAQAAGVVLAPDLAAVSALAGRSLPPLRDVQVSANLSGAELSAVRVQAGAAELGGGVRLVRLSGSAPGMAQPVQMVAELFVGSLPVAAAANAGSLAAVLGRGPIPVQLSVAANGATFGAQGSVASLTGSGLDVAVSAGVPDLQRLGALAGLALPPLRNGLLEARLALAPAGLLVRGMRLAMLQGDVAGDLALGLSPRPSIRGSLVSQRLDLDAWTASAPPAPAGAAPAGADPAGSAVTPAPPERLLPDVRLPFAALQRFDADLQLGMGEAVWRGTAYRKLEMRLLLQDGRLRLDPLSLQSPGGPVQAQILADAAAVPPTLAIMARAPGLAAGPALAVLGAPEGTTGTIDLDVQLRGQGDTLRAWAATLEGHLGLAMVDGEIENRWLAELLGEALRAANLPVEPGGRSRVRCLALRADAMRGQARLRALALDSTRLKLEGEGGLNLADETLDLHLRPQLRVGATISVPLRVGGTFQAPKPALDPGALSPGRVGVLLGAPAADTCGPALAAARDGRAGPSPAAADPSRGVRPGDLLRSLLR